MDKLQNEQLHLFEFYLEYPPVQDCPDAINLPIDHFEEDLSCGEEKDTDDERFHCDDSEYPTQLIYSPDFNFEAENEFRTNEAENEERIPWSDDDIYELRYSLIYQALASIRDKRKTASQRKESWDWFVKDDYSSPFSCCNCAKYTGLDIEELRILVFALVPEL